MQESGVWKAVRSEEEWRHANNWLYADMEWNSDD